MICFKSAEKLVTDERYPFETVMEDIFSDYEIMLLLLTLKGCTQSVTRHVRSETKDLKTLDHNCSMLTSFEIVNNVFSNIKNGLLKVWLF